MGKQFSWHTDPELSPDPSHHSSQFSLHFSSLRGPGMATAVTILLIFAITILVWLSSQVTIKKTQAARRQQVNTLLAQAQQALLAGDGDSFFALFSEDAAWQAAQLQPINQALYRNDSEARQVQQYKDVLQVHVQWTDGDAAWQRMVYLQETDNAGTADLLFAPPQMGYWGDVRRQRTAWGLLSTYQVDAAWAGELTQFVEAVIAELCAQECVQDQLPLTLVVANGYEETAVPNILRIPSPRLVALDDNGNPAPPFWNLLRQKLTAYLQPAHIRFALPPQMPVGIHLVDYEQAAAQFSAAHPHITIELITLDEIPQDPAQLRLFDGAAFAPTPQMIAAGEVRDLSNLAATDVRFQLSDFYPQILQGAWWRDRLWFVPQAGEMQVLYYDENAYAAAERPLPSLRWTWEEMMADLQALNAALPFEERPFANYRFFDITPDILYAYAYTQNPTELTPESAAAALAWYQETAAQPHFMPDVASLTDEERQNNSFRWWAFIWVDKLIYYEHRVQIVGNMGVVPFPGSAQFDGATPLHLYGSFITQGSQHPQAVWEWLTFLSYQQTAPRYRLIPARASVAEASGYWQMLPRPLAEALRAGFPFARPVTLEDMAYFDWEMVTAVTHNQLPPSQAAQQTTPLFWFAAP